ncbi:Molecular chaperone Prefoldin, subunit 3 [Phaffia rhodozyma]|uniref:Prefoldin subunit 3 n=1 Tax=Phaffia rhodozyma TaxID=264483 RepID=A0A0F7ST47_PHARH|nr:Molecular chaperone Prefoldin, subunit 3 [Phaffia rhodozyma]
MASSKTASSSTDIPSNPRGIPAAPFVANVEEYIGGPDGDCESALRKFQEMVSKYRYMEINLNQRRKGLEEKIPDIRKTLSVVEHLISRREAPSTDDDELNSEEGSESAANKPLEALFELNDTLYSSAQIEETGDVYLWLGANTMLSYPLAEAHSLLSAKLAAAEENLQGFVEDVEFIREQATVMDVNVARVYNFDVKRRREKKEALALTGQTEEAEEEDKN